MLPINTISFGAGAKPNGRPVQANAPDDRIPRGPGGYRLKSVCADFIPACSLVYRTILRALRMRFLRHGGIYLVRCGLLLNPNLGGRVASRQPLLPRSENASGGPHSPHRPQMSSGRLFLDRVGRHQSPSPLHRRDQNKPIARSEGTTYHRTVSSVLTGCLSFRDRRRSISYPVDAGLLIPSRTQLGLGLAWARRRLLGDYSP